MKYSSSFGAFAATLAGAAVLQQGWLWALLWPATSFAVVALGYAGLGPCVFGKRPDGSFSRVMIAVLLPHLLLTWTVWRLLRIVSSEPACQEIPGAPDRTHTHLLHLEILTHCC